MYLASILYGVYALSAKTLQGGSGSSMQRRIQALKFLTVKYISDNKISAREIVVTENYRMVKT
jgi:hypothetical protein